MILRPVKTAGSAGTPARVKTGLVGSQDGVNLEFVTAENFQHVGNVLEWVFLNGMQLQEGATRDYVASESGGVGTGFDTITLAIPPLAVDDLSIIYIPAN